MAKSKLTREEKARFKEAFKACSVQIAKENIHWAFCPITGVTIIYKEMPRGNFVKVSVAYCSDKDVFKKKIGLVVAIDRWYNNESIQIPVHEDDVRLSIEKFVALITGGAQALEYANN